MKLDVIKEEIQKVAEAISLVLKIDVTIVNDNMERIAGTGIYKDKIGAKILGSSAFKKSYEDKKTLIIDNPRESILCEGCYRVDDCEEKAEVCCPIILDEKCYGVIGLIAFDEGQKDIITKSSDELILFMEKMASLISGSMKAEIKSFEYNIEKEKIIKIFDSMDRPMVSTDENGKIDSYNSKFMKMFKLSVDPSGKEIYRVLDFIGADVFDSLKGSNKHIEFFNSKKTSRRGIYNINKIYYKSILKGFVIDFVDKKDAIRNYNKMNVDYRMTLDDIIGRSKIVNAVKENSLKASESTSSILITGESGTGKEMFARAIHSHSKRCDKPFFTINCAAIPGELLESELFGYEEGAFTGAKKGGKLGIFEIANTGTIFLDEVGDMSIHLQSKLLRVLQEKEIQKVGAKENIVVDVRIISATNKNLSEMVEKGLFREDLYYRLNVIPLHLPSLRERVEDIPLLVEHMLRVYSEKLEKNIYGVSNEVMKMLESYSWPGNIRELQNVIEYCVNMSNDEEIVDVDILKNRFEINNLEFNKRQFRDIDADDTKMKKNGENNKTEVNIVKNDVEIIDKTKSEDNDIDELLLIDKVMGTKIDISKIEELEKEEIKKALETYKYFKFGKNLAAKKLGISRASLYRKIKKYKL